MLITLEPGADRRNVLRVLRQVIVDTAAGAVLMKSST
jgi:hypothetical protein